MNPDKGYKRRSFLRLVGIATMSFALTPSIVQRYVTTGTDVGALAVIGHTDVSSGEYLSLVTRNISAAADTTALFATVLLVDFAA